LLFADEPTGSLMRPLTYRTAVRTESQAGATLVLVTHDESLASRCQRASR
jgi:putative ABC transport system ATP-binding protein